MKLLVLGASGGIGQWIVRLAVDRGHDVTALVRPRATFPAVAGANVVRGEALESRMLGEVMPGHDAVLSSIGQRRGGKNPWAKTLSPPTLVESVMRALVPAMNAAQVRRLVFVSAGGVGDSAAQATQAVRWVITQGSMAIAYRDLARAEAVAAATTLDWLAVRPVTLVPGRPTGRAAPIERYGVFSMVRRSDVAAWMLDAVARPQPFSDDRVLLGTRWPGSGR
jgi:putative NADH-flavin reductase